MILLDIVNEKIKKSQPIKLHVGCGSNIIDDYINVDGPWMSHEPKIAIHNLIEKYPLPDNSIDEILSVHVIEHISRKHVPQMFQEWYRILKPGGKVITEWPDVLKACKKIAKFPEILLSEDRRDLKSTMFVFFFDDTRYDSDSMIHRWGYSEQSLGETFKKYGFTSWRSELNQYKKSGVDSRIVAFK